MSVRDLFNYGLVLLDRLFLPVQFPLNVIMRQHMGRKYCTIWRLLAHSGVMGTFFYVVAWWRFFAHPEDPAQAAEVLLRDLYAAVALGFCVWFFGLANLLQNHRYRRLGVKVHPYEIGVPRFLPWTLFSNRWLVPLSTLVLGGLVWTYSELVGLYVLLCGLLQVWEHRQVRLPTPALQGV